MKRRAFLKSAVLTGAGAATAAWPGQASAAAPCSVRGTGDLGIVVERATGSVLIVETTGRTVLGRVEGLGDLSHASVVFSRDERHAYVFGRDGGLTRIDMLGLCLAGRVVQSGNAIGGAISDDGRLVAVSNYTPGGVRVFDAATLELVADLPATGADGKASKTVGLVDAPGRRFVYCLYDAGEIWIADFSGADVKAPKVTRLAGIGKLPYDASITSDGRHYIAGLFGEDGLVHVDMWNEPPEPKRILDQYGRGEVPLPVFKMPHLEGWALMGDRFLLPAVGRHELLAVDAPPPPEAIAEQPEDIPLGVVFEDDCLLVIDKPAGLVVHPGSGNWAGTLLNALLHRAPALAALPRAGIVHRLDKDTTGLIVVAKTDVAHAGLTEQFQSHGADGRLSRTYVALVWGVPTPRVGTIDAPLGRSTSNRLKIAVRRGEDGRHAVTHYEVVRSFAGRAGTPCVSEVRLHLETGRTHQIRVHMGHIGHPLLGDPVYGTGFNSSIDKLPESAAALLRNLGRQALHAAELGFEHPTSGRPLHFVSPVPADIGNLITALDRGGGSQYRSRG